eukprot:TRINITY_DN9208_c0_g3_i1.p1 TRINITY_DN9208_c0_g3~~TRINITY_DN9208_c0_g3_i1.p1  ORF type:complete len:202 (-),score=34.71 TRINITY_DN9208_c0_g3_i1:130-702(-)
MDYVTTELDMLRDAMSCDVCRAQPAARRLLMEVGVARSARALRRGLAVPRDPAEQAVIQEELLLAQRVLDELRQHRAHTPFFKVVARKSPVGKASYYSVYDGETVYELGKPSLDKGGCFVHASEEEACRSIASFPRSSAAWGAPRALLMVRGEGGVRLRHGKVLFDGITPLAELPLGSTGRQEPRPAWRF